MSNIYIENGYNNRREYLESLAEEFDIPFSIVSSISEILGPIEDFDGLINSLEDYTYARDM